MTQEERILYTKTCAEFLGYTNPIIDKDFYFVEHDKYNEESCIPKLLELNFEKRFHSDWNWIMEVRDKILSINAYSSLGQRFIFNMNATAKHNKNENDKPYKVRIKGVLISETRPFIEVDSFNEKEAVVQAINQFLIWYKEQTL